MKEHLKMFTNRETLVFMHNYNSLYNNMTYFDRLGLNHVVVYVIRIHSFTAFDFKIANSTFFYLFIRD